MKHQKTDSNRKQQKQQILSKTQELLDLIVNYEDYVRYQNELQELKDSPELYQKLQEYRRKNLTLQLIGEEDNSYEKMQDLYKEYKDTLMDPMVSRFMMTEQSIIKLMRKVQDQLTQGIEMDTSYMDE